MQISNPQSELVWVYEQVKFWGPISFAIGIIVRGYYWLKTLRESDLKNINDGVNTLKAEVATQTSSFVKAMEGNTQELKELRRDLYIALVAPSPMAAKAKAKKK